MIHTFSIWSVGLMIFALPTFAQQVPEPIYFQTASHQIQQAYRPSLDSLLIWLEKYPKYKLEIQGHTDSVGSAEYNMILSQQRAMEAYHYLTFMGVDSSRLTTKAYGRSKPAIDNLTSDHRQLNRRIEYKITYPITKSSTLKCIGAIQKVVKVKSPYVSFTMEDLGLADGDVVRLVVNDSIYAKRLTLRTEETKFRFKLNYGRNYITVYALSHGQEGWATPYIHVIDRKDTHRFDLVAKKGEPATCVIIWQ